jgi:hypothetical protein
MRRVLGFDAGGSLEIRRSSEANHLGGTLTFAEHVFDVKENIERVFAPNV